jgi:hypothetical protein
MIRSMAIVGLALLGMTALVAPTHAADDMAAQVQSAKTAADHEALAKTYDAQAASASKSAAEHRTMAEAYKSAAATSGGKGAGVSAMPGHCEALAKSYDAEAEHYRSMAQTHRDIAKGM